MPIKNIIVTASIGSYPSHSYGQKMYISSTDEQSFPIENFEGGNGGSMPDGSPGEISKTFVITNGPNPANGSYIGCYNSNLGGYYTITKTAGVWTQPTWDQTLSGATWQDLFTILNANMYVPYSFSISSDNVISVVAKTSGVLYDIFNQNLHFDYNDQGFITSNSQILTGGVDGNKNFVFISQSWSGINDTKAGLVPFTHNTQDEFYNGEFSGSALVVSTQSLHLCDGVSTVEKNYKYYFYKSTITSLANFLNKNTTPPQGNIYIFWDQSPVYQSGEGR